VRLVGYSEHDRLIGRRGSEKVHRIPYAPTGRGYLSGALDFR
jgi:hypothetical protein